MNAHTGQIPTPRPDYARTKLENELAALRQRRRKLSADISGRDMTGDDADTAQAMESSENLAWLTDRIAELESRLIDQTPTQRSALPTDTEVTLRFPDGDAQTFRIVAIPEEIFEGEEDTTITVDSPLGHALVDRDAGDTISYTTAAGRMHAEVLNLRVPSGR